MKHATVRIGEYTVPLIGVPKDATREKCCKCGKKFYIGDMTVDAKFNPVCKKCNDPKRLPNER